MLTTPVLRRLPSRRQVLLAALAALVFLVSLLTYQNGSLNFSVYRLDLDVYRVGAQAWMHGKDLYGKLPPISDGLSEPFTYPPISAVVMAPLALVSTTLAGVLMTAVSLSLLICVLVLFLRATKLADGPGSWKLAIALLPLAVLIEPVRTTLAYGQINIVLMALVSADCLLPSTWFTVRGRRVGWPRGALTGLAAGLKLTPLVFLLYFVGRRDWRGARNLVGGFAVATTLGFIFCPSDSWQYWTSKVFQTNRIGLPFFSSNQSITGVLYRAQLTGSAENRTWLAVCAVIGVIALTAVYKAAKEGRQVTALALAACTELLVSPVSWSHHWVWAAPVLVCALVKGWRQRRTVSWRYLTVTAAVAAVFLSEPQIWFPHTGSRELRWGLWEQIIGSAYVWVALVTLCIFAFRPARPAAEQSAVGSDQAVDAAASSDATVVAKPEPDAEAETETDAEAAEMETAPGKEPASSSWSRR